MSAGTLTFIHRFSRSVQCEIRIKDEPPLPNAMFVLPCQWTGRPERKHLTVYRQWVLATNQLLANRWQTSILYALGTARDKTELWGFKPGQPPKLLQTLSVGIP